MAADKLAENQKSYLKIRIFHNLIVNFWGHTSMLLPLIIGIVFIINQKMDLASVMFITQISSNLLWLSEGMASSISDIQKAKVSCDRVLEILSLPDESYNFIPNESEINQQDLPIVFENVSVSFNGKNVLENVNLKIPLNQFTDIIGESGSGKSTLVKSLLGLVNYSGKIYLYGKEIHSYDLCELRQKISYTPQETMLFNASISKNINYGRMEASNEEIINAAQKAYASEFIDKLQQNYDTVIGTGENALSQGQYQRISMARALLKNSPIYIFDEITSALDSYSETKIYNTILDIAKNVTIIMITHKLELISKADNVITLNKLN